MKYASAPPTSAFSGTKQDPSGRRLGSDEQQPEAFIGYPTLSEWDVQAEVLLRPAGSSTGPTTTGSAAGSNRRPPAVAPPGVVQGIPFYPGAAAGGSGAGVSEGLHPYNAPPASATHPVGSGRPSSGSSTRHRPSSQVHQYPPVVQSGAVAVQQRRDSRQVARRRAVKVTQGVLLGAVAGVLCCFGIPVLL